MSAPAVFGLLLMMASLAAGPGAAARTVRVTCRDGMAATPTSCKLGCPPTLICDADRECGGGCAFSFDETCRAWWCQPGTIVVPVGEKQVFRVRPKRRLVLRCASHPERVPCPPPIPTTTTSTTTSSSSTTTTPGGSPPTPCNGARYPTCDGACEDGAVCAVAIVDALSTCACFAPTSPCGETGPVCNGMCGTGERCAPLGPGLLDGCGCIPEGSTACGGVAPACSGACPGDQVCRPGIGRPVLGSGLGCFCAARGPCGGGGVDCPNGFACGVIPPGPAQCFPIMCGSYPMCGGTSASGAECLPLLVELSGGSTLGLCINALPGACDSTCGGYECPGGQVCRYAGGTCGCEAGS